MPSIDQSAEIVEGKVGDVSCEAAVANMPKSCDDGNLDLLVDSVIVKPSPMKTLSDLNRPRYYATKVGCGLSSPRRKSALYKTEMCRNWVETQKCPYDHLCQFAHGSEEMRHLQPAKKTRLCRTFMRHMMCPFGERCDYLHDRTALAATRLPIPTKTGELYWPQPFNHLPTVNAGDLAAHEQEQQRARAEYERIQPYVGVIANQGQAQMTLAPNAMQCMPSPIAVHGNPHAPPPTPAYHSQQQPMYTLDSQMAQLNVNSHVSYPTTPMTPATYAVGPQGTPVQQLYYVQQSSHPQQHTPPSSSNSPQSIQSAGNFGYLPRPNIGDTMEQRRQDDIFGDRSRALFEADSHWFDQSRRPSFNRRGNRPLRSPKTPGGDSNEFYTWARKRTASYRQPNRKISPEELNGGKDERAE